MNHIYLHTSNFENIPHLKNDSCFQPAYEYRPTEMFGLPRNEYGRIETKANYYHILIGQMPQFFCPWCGTEPEIIQTFKPDPEGTIPPPAQYQLICTKCGSRGPILNVNQFYSAESDEMAHYMDFMRQRYANRLPWDHTQPFNKKE